MRGTVLYKMLAIIVVIVFSFICHTACEAQNTYKPDWPQYVWNSVWVPRESVISRYSHRLSYEIVYSTHVCYPAKSLIDEMVAAMTSQGWKRLKHDPVNPEGKSRLNHAMTPMPRWIAGLDKNYSEVYGWKEFWEDTKGNITEYSFTYKLGKGEIIGNACSMSGVSAFISKDDLKVLLKAFKDMPIKPPRED